MLVTSNDTNNAIAIADCSGIHLFPLMGSSGFAFFPRFAESSVCKKPTLTIGNIFHHYSFLVTLRMMMMPGLAVESRIT
ncbi:hypothetical protein FGO68_gene8776 [Halteria grandinella]|uniref:Uncharacterized protein n=1 Tax=Halteria grandinella TaxID=5974 RepID=A0A8J8NBD3_HALGN|nr:hypothetical protein FGO68_gene8776 [Halteria grandinella]